MKRITGVFARLETPVDFEALDDQPVDLVFLLLAPEGAGADHLKALSRIARVLRDADTVAKIRGTATPARSTRFCRRRRPRTPPEAAERLNMQKGGTAALCRLRCCAPIGRAAQWSATGTRSFSKAPATARSRCVRQQDRLAVGGKQRPQLGARRNLGKTGEFALQIFAFHFAHIGDRAFAEMGELGLALSSFSFQQ